MHLNRPTKTLADYMVVAISPLLVIVLVHSVCFFLVDVLYRGEAAGGVRWVLFWFILAVVLISRIGIEQGDAPAAAYGLLLAGATWLYLSLVQHNVVFGAILLAVVWFTAHKITSNCTLVDDDVDASGQGLMQSLRRLPARLKRNLGPATPSGPDRTAHTGPELPDSSRSPGGEKKQAKSSTAQVPGIWLIYFSLAALPIFGVGQRLLPAGDLAARQRGFVYLFSYLAAALGLLITTSFLGLRRYLRQRYVIMPPKIALGWLQFGVTGALIVLCASLLLPRPGAGEAWGGLRYHIDYQLRRASQYAARFNPPGQGSGRAGNQTPPSGSTENPPTSAGPDRGPNGNLDRQPGSPNDQRPGPASNAGAPAGGSGGKTGRPAPALSPAASPLYSIFKALFYLAAIAGLAWLLHRYRVTIFAVFRSAWAAIRGLIAALFRRAPAPPAEAAKQAGIPAFKTFKNPFLSGADRIWGPAQLIAYSYEALQSWALEEEAAHSPQTPREFCRQLAAEMPEAADALEHLAFLYGHVAYGASLPGNYHPEQLRRIWESLALPRQRGEQNPERAVTGKR